MDVVTVDINNKLNNFWIAFCKIINVNHSANFKPLKSSIRPVKKVRAINVQFFLFNLNSFFLYFIVSMPNLLTYNKVITFLSVCATLGGTAIMV